MAIRNARMSDLPSLQLYERADGLVKSASDNTTARVFLSHSHIDKENSSQLEAVARAMKVIENHGATVYMDDLDPRTKSLKPNQIANYLRERISVCSRVIALGTSNLSSSRWIPWELGVGDGIKGRIRVGLFPIDISAIERASIEQEYLQTYPTIMVDESVVGYRQTTSWTVYDPTSNNFYPLRNWLIS